VVLLALKEAFSLPIPSRLRNGGACSCLLAARKSCILSPQENSLDRFKLNRNPKFKGREKIFHSLSLSKKGKMRH
jgi:hypothetical protein